MGLTGLSSAQAQAALEPVVVTATRSPLAASRVLADVSVVDRAAIERSGALSLGDVLQRLPGIELARNGGPGTATSLFLRGGETRHTAVYIDGLRVDSQSTGGAAWEGLPLELVERIEVLRGPGAAAYGSDAVAGVVQIFTRRGREGLQAGASLTLGSWHTAVAQANLAGASGGVDYALALSQGRSDGYNARPIATANPDDDGWRRSSAQARVGWALLPGQRIEATLNTHRLRSQYDGSLANDDVSRHTLRSGGLSWQGRWSESSQTRVLLGETRTTYETQPSYYRTETTLRNLTVQHDQRFGAHQLGVTLERREDGLLNPATAFAATLEGDRHQDALGLLWRSDLGDHSIQAQARHDKDSEFGGHATGSLAWGWRFQPGWRATVSAGTSFRAPTLYQRFSQYGVATLEPESGRNLEVGLRWASNGSELGLVAWRNRVEDLINFGAAGPCASTFGCYENAGRAQYEGVTLSGRHSLGALALSGSADWHDPRNLDTDKQLARRARKSARLAVDYRLAAWSFGAEWQGVGQRFDNAANTLVLPGYGLVNLRAGHELSPGLSLEARVDNVADKAYQTANTYAQPGRTAQLALRWAMR
ncbi:MAG: TonB-dependent receptor [Burkholderiaceae bacterium]|nr:TonB-dependent receptor [Burkholderiaceae bacterium]